MSSSQQHLPNQPESHISRAIYESSSRKSSSSNNTNNLKDNARLNIRRTLSAQHYTNNKNKANDDDDIDPWKTASDDEDNSPKQNKNKTNKSTKSQQQQQQKHHQHQQQDDDISTSSSIPDFKTSLDTDEDGYVKWESVKDTSSSTKGVGSDMTFIPPSGVSLSSSLSIRRPPPNRSQREPSVESESSSWVQINANNTNSNKTQSCSTFDDQDHHLRPEFEDLLYDPTYMLGTLRVASDGTFVRVPIQPTPTSVSSTDITPTQTKQGQNQDQDRKQEQEQDNSENDEKINKTSISSSHSLYTESNSDLTSSAEKEKNKEKPRQAPPLGDSIVFVEHDLQYDMVDSPSRVEERREGRRKGKFMTCLTQGNVNMTELRELAWSGVPNELRGIVWQLLLDYLPTQSQERSTTLARKRKEYNECVKETFANGTTDLDQVMWHQIHIDVHRTHPNLPLWQFSSTQRSLERILYIWSLKHPASGYVQGINDLATPFFQVFLSLYIDAEPEEYDIANLPEHVLEAVEADTFWCLSKLLEGIQDNYTTAQPGIHRQVARMKELCHRIDSALAIHLENQNVEFMQFAFRWMNCLLMREMSVKSIIRLWDTYLAEGTDAFSEYHIYVCLSFLIKWSEKLRSMEFQEIIMFLQSLPSTQTWTESQTELLLSEAFMWKSLFHNAQSHLK